MEKEIISLYKGNLRYQNILNSLNQIKLQILNKIKNKSSIIIKPNLVSDINQMASVHVDTVKAILDFLKPHYKNKITIAEGSGYSTETAFRNFNYIPLKKEYNIQFKELNNDNFKEITGYKRNLEPQKLGISKTILNSDCIISITIPKTHDSVIATLGIKNIAVGSLIKKSLIQTRFSNDLLRKIINRATSIRNDKAKIHQGPKAINKNIFEIYKRIKPDISIIDAYQAMENNGPVDGTPVNLKLAITGTSAIATDVVASQIMGLNPYNIGYLYYIMKYENFNPKDVKIIGNTTIKKEKTKFRLHDNIKNQLNWL